MKRALLLIDVQNEYFTGALPVTYPHNSFENIQNVMQAAKEMAIPVVAVQHTATAQGAKTFVKGTHGWELHDFVKAANAQHYVEKTVPSSFVGTDLKAWLRKNEIDTVVISGYMTQHCCDTTARYAHHLGFNVEFLSDATGTLDFNNYAGKASAEEIHRVTLVEQAFRFSDVLSTKEWMAKVKGS